MSDGSELAYSLAACILEEQCDGRAEFGRSKLRCSDVEV
jgi:hypothetical protein